MVELASIVILGVFAQWVAWKTEIPAILPLIIIGLLVGPVSTYFTHDGLKWIDPIFQMDKNTGLFPAEVLFYFVTLSIGIILFEGGLTLNLKEVRGMTPAIIGLLTVGPLVTFIGAAIPAHYLLGLEWRLSFLFSSLIIVTGPTVIGPILRHLPIKKEVAAILKWEGILIDPVGALIAILMFEFIVAEANDATLAEHALKSFAQILIIGTSIGFSAAYAFYYILKNELIPKYLVNVSALAYVLFIFVVSDVLAKESGLLAVVVMGMVLANFKLKVIHELLDFKEAITILLVSILFILLSANMNMDQLLFLFDGRILILFLIILLLIRPLGVFISARRTKLSTKEKWFISFIGPRGIVAAGIASLFGLKLQGVLQGAEFITPIVFMVVLGTVLFTSIGAKGLAKIFGVWIEKFDGILIVGANDASRLIASYLKKMGKNVILLDRSPEKIQEAKQMGLHAILADVYVDDLSDIVDLNEMGYLIAMTENPRVNKYVLDEFKRRYGEQGHFRLLSPEEILMRKENVPHEGLFSCTDDYFNLHNVAQQYPEVHERHLEETGVDLIQILNAINCNKETIPLLLKHKNGDVEFISSHLEDLNDKEVESVVYFGKALDLEELKEAPEDELSPPPEQNGGEEKV